MLQGQKSTYVEEILTILHYSACISRIHQDQCQETGFNPQQGSMTSL